MEEKLHEYLENIEEFIIVNEKPIEKKKVVVSSKEEQKIVKQDMFKEEIIENYKGNNIEEEYI